MKFKNTLFIALGISAIVITSGCKKAPASTLNEQQQHNQDVSNTKSESDNVNVDVNNAVSGENFGKNNSVDNTNICGGTIDASNASGSQPYILINFDGQTPCGSPSRIRSGQIKVQLVTGTAWHNPGSVLAVTYNNYKVVFTSDNHSMLFHGQKFLTDQNGINWLTWLSGLDTLSLKENTSNITVQFETGQTASWNWDRVSKWWLSGATIYAVVNGDSLNGNQVIDSWGQTRWGTYYTTYMNTPWQANSNCGWWRPTAGQYTSTTTNFTVGATFGTDASGTPVNSGCPNYFDLTWTITSPSSNGSIVLPYW